MKKRVALVMLSDPSLYPPTLNAATILVEEGYQVDLIGLRYKKQEAVKIDHRVNFKYIGNLDRGIYFRYIYLKLFFLMIISALTQKYTFYVCYNHKAMLPVYLGALISGKNWIYHNHDISIWPEKYGFNYFLKWFERWSINKSNLMVLPQNERSEYFIEEMGLDNELLIIYNCPLKNWPKNKIHSSIIEYHNNYKIILYQGDLNWKRGLRNIILSMEYWDDDWLLCLVGKNDLEDSFHEVAHELHQTLKSKAELLILPAQDYYTLSSITAYCHIGLAVMLKNAEDTNLNIQMLAGASNKVAEYMASGLPIIAPDSEGYDEIFNRYECGLTLDPQNIQSIANSIRYILDNDYEKSSNNSKSAFENEYNYNYQFDKLMKIVSKWN